ncbi:TIGR02569 family protein [Georgenia halophila]|uniref:TIGR02569 family protein n=1 Tax=Georgenia halophila TaxID=620889 RepID=A0ABP8LBB1_9MICO
MPPSAQVLAAFGVASAAPTRLRGGQDVAWRAADLVLKPVDMPADALVWLDTVLRPRADGTDLRLGLPRRSRTGRLEVDGWCAFPFLAGRHEPGRWRDVAAVGRRFARLTAGLDRPGFLDARTDPWAVADRFAWGEADPSGLRDEPSIAALVARRSALHASSGIVHGDLTGNVLFHPELPPALIDLSLYWRPVPYGTAVVAVDAVCFAGAPLDLPEQLDDDPEFSQHLLRALLFRMATDLLGGAGHEALTPYRAAVERVCAAAGEVSPSGTSPTILGF